MNFLSHYKKFQTVSSSATVNASREKALNFARTQGLPTRKNEDWKYTSLKALAEKNYSPATLANSQLVASEKIKIQSLFNSDFINIVFVNGLLNKDLSEILPAEVTLSEVEIDKKTFADTFEALSYLYNLKAYSVFVKKEFAPPKPIHFIFWTQGQFVMSSMLLQIFVESRSQIRFIETHTGAGNDYFSNNVLDIQLAESAKASLIKVQEENLQATHIGRTRVVLKATSEFDMLTFSTGAHLARHSLEVFMQGEGSSAQVNGVYAVSGTQHVDNDTTIDHQVGHCSTVQLYKGILDGESRAVFNGKVLIRKNSQKASSAQLNNNLLLSRKAEADSKPILEIEADDVKASHGSTVGQMDKEELFYLLSRAIPKSKAISMMSYGFLAEVIERVSHEPTQAWLKEKLDRAFERLSTEVL